MLPAPMFEVRWRWDTSRALAVLRFAGGRKVPPPLQRMEADDLLAADIRVQLASKDLLTMTQRAALGSGASVIALVLCSHRDGNLSHLRALQLRVRHRKPVTRSTSDFVQSTSSKVTM
jgi:hypothetical protein